MSLPEPRVYAPLDRPDVEVEWVSPAGVRTWVPGELRMWEPLEGEDGEVVWSGLVQYNRPGERNHRLDSFPSERIRLDTVDRSYGREV